MPRVVSASLWQQHSSKRDRESKVGESADFFFLRAGRSLHKEAATHSEWSTYLSCVSIATTSSSICSSVLCTSVDLTEYCRSSPRLSGGPGIAGLFSGATGGDVPAPGSRTPGGDAPEMSFGTATSGTTLLLLLLAAAAAGDVCCSGTTAASAAAACLPLLPAISPLLLLAGRLPGNLELTDLAERMVRSSRETMSRSTVWLVGVGWGT